MTPKLRFPEFTDEWQVKKLGDILSVGSGRDYKHLKNGKVPVYGTGGLMTFVDDFLHDGKSVAIGRKGTIDQPQFLEGKFWTVDTLFYTYDYRNSIPEFIFSLFQNINWKKWNEASGVPSLSSSTIKSIKVTIPAKPEQEKISYFMTAVDERIAVTERKLELLETYKRGVMQKIFSQQIRFKNENGDPYPDWEEKKLKHILKIRGERNNKNETDEVFSVAKSAGVINQIEHLGRSFASKEISNYKIARPGDIIYTKSPTSDFPYGIIKQNMTNRTGVVSVLYGVYEPANIHVGRILDEYFESWQNTYNYLNPIVQKGAKNTINISDAGFLEGKVIYLPISREEQQKIADFLTTLDEKITAEKSKLAATRQFKKALMQRMFV